MARVSSVKGKLSQEGMGLIKGGGLKQFRGILYLNMGDFGRFYAKFSDLKGVKTA